MNNNVIPYAITLTIAMYGCATGYHAKSFTGGYSEKKISADRYRVRYEANFWTGRSTNQRYLYYRCAELTHEKGYNYFIVQEAVKGSAMGIPVGFPVSEATIQLKRGRPDRNNPQAIEAQKVMKEKRSRLGK